MGVRFNLGDEMKESTPPRLVGVPKVVVGIQLPKVYTWNSSLVNGFEIRTWGLKVDFLDKYGFVEYELHSF